MVKTDRPKTYDDSEFIRGVRSKRRRAQWGDTFEELDKFFRELIKHLILAVIALIFAYAMYLAA